MNAPTNTEGCTSTLADLLEERQRHAETRAQLEIVAEELRAQTDLVAITTEALADARMECNTLMQKLRDRALEQDGLEATIASVLRGSGTSLFLQDRRLRYAWACPMDAVGKSDHDLLPRDEADVLAALKREVIRTGRSARRRLTLTMDGRRRRAEIYVEPVAGGDASLVEGVCGVLTFVGDDTAG